MRDAAAAWDGLAAELWSAAESYGSVVSELTGGPWLGPSSTSMAALVAPYVAWMTATAAQAEEAADHARAASGAYETAFAATVPPPVIAANRAQLMALIATNFLGQNSPAIAATEAQYGEMWAQDAAAMYSYADASSAASTVTPFMSPPHTTGRVKLADQAAAAPRALPQLPSAAPPSTSSTTTPTSWLQGFLNGLAPADRQALFRAVQGACYSLATPQYLMSTGQQLTSGLGGTVAGAGGPWYPTPQFVGAGGLGGPGGGGPVSASVGQAGGIGRLSVPPSWAASPAALDSASQGSASTHAATHLHPEPSGLLRRTPLRGTSFGRRANTGFIHHYGFRQPVVPRPPSAG